VHKYTSKTERARSERQAVCITLASAGVMTSSTRFVCFFLVPSCKSCSVLASLRGALRFCTRFGGFYTTTLHEVYLLLPSCARRGGGDVSTWKTRVCSIRLNVYVCIYRHFERRVRCFRLFWFAWAGRQTRGDLRILGAATTAEAIGNHSDRIYLTFFLIIN
jgi:hypothetical protein